MTVHPTAPRGGTTVLRRVLVGQRWLVLGAALFLMSWQACESLVPATIGAIIDRAIEPRDGQAMVAWIGVLAGLFLVLSLSFRFGSRLSRRAAEQAGHDARVTLTARLLDPVARLDPTHNTGRLVSVAGSDTDRVGALAAMVPRTCAAVASVLVTAAVLLRISVPLSMLVLAGCPVLLAAVHLIGAPLERRSGIEQARAAEAAALATDLIGGLRVIKGIGAGQAAADRYAAASRRSLHATLLAARTGSIYDAATLLLTMLFLALVALVGGRLATDGRISIGDLVAAVGLAQFLIGPLSQLAATGTGLARARASAARIAAASDARWKPPGTRTVTTPIRGDLTVHHRGLEFGGAAGELLGIAADHADAADLIALIVDAPFADTDSVHVDGVPVRHLAPQAANSVLLVARHDTHLFAATVLSNVLAGQPDTQRVRAAIAAADADQVAETLPAGLDTVLTEHGRSLSGGQRQRVALARALAAVPPILVLHDPTTAVDAVTEARIALGLRQLRTGLTTIIIATSPALLAVCDRVLFIRDGQVRAEGSHAHLAATEPDYHNLVLG